ncbi:MAG TPA: hypothetical protein DCM59_13780 [Clostridium sp.]|nr:hypothetical protein [Clostridium sp.]
MIVPPSMFIVPASLPAAPPIAAPLLVEVASTTPPEIFIAILPFDDDPDPMAAPAEYELVLVVCAFTYPPEINTL